jgi:hypothetical protein
VILETLQKNRQCLFRFYLKYTTSIECVQIYFISLLLFSLY